MVVKLSYTNSIFRCFYGGLYSLLMGVVDLLLDLQQLDRLLSALL